MFLIDLNIRLDYFEKAHMDHKNMAHYVCLISKVAWVRGAGMTLYDFFAKAKCTWFRAKDLVTKQK